MTTNTHRCPALHPDLPYSRCVFSEGHSGPHLNTPGSEWSDSPDLMDGGVTAAAIENDDKPVSFMTKARTRALIKERNDWRHQSVCNAQASAENLERALRAERERDAAVDSALLATQPRPLTAGDITDEARQRAVDAWWVWKANGAALVSVLVDAILTAALTEPTPEPQRPEGAEELDGHVDASLRGVGLHPLSADELRIVADNLADSGVRALRDQR